MYRDEALLILDKPAGVLSHPNPGSGKAPNVLVRAPYDAETECFRVRYHGEPDCLVWLVHRLDLDTSGLIVCTFDAESAARLKEALYHRDFAKTYTALVLGCPGSPRGEWNDRLERSAGRDRIDVRVASGASNAATDWTVERRFERAGLALLSLSPRTGRTHQLRVQCAHHGHPIAGDERYGDFGSNRFLRQATGLRHMFLHATRLEFRHPRSGKRLSFHRGPSRRLTEPLERLEELRDRVPRRSG